MGFPQINRNQSREERKEKYARLIFFGATHKEARRGRDWTHNHIDIFIKAKNQNA